VTVRLNAAIRNGAMDAIPTAIGSNGLLRIYNGTQPANVAAALSGNTLLAELALSATSAPAASSGVLTFSAISSDTSADATGTQTWATLTTSAGTRVVDMSCGNGSGDLNLAGTITATGTVAVTSLTITDNNA